MTLVDGQTVGNRYRIHDQIGGGGMGVVFRATDRLTSQIVALKRVLTLPNPSDPSEASSFFTSLTTEFRTLAGLRHPNIVSVLDYGFDADRQPYFTMSLLEKAQTIAEAAQGKSLPEKVQLLVEMLTALSYLHRRGILHRDLKPSNVLVSEGVKLLDFGLAIAAQSTADLESSAVGTLYYMAPELLLEEAPSMASDLYAVGVIICEVFSGRRPFDEKSAGALISRILQGMPDLSGLEGEIALIVGRLLAKKPRDRYTDANGVIAALCQATGQPIPSESQAVRESFLQASTFVGREAEMEPLNAALNAVLVESELKQAQVWLIGGESGVGKSRLLDELRTRALVRGARVLRGQGVAEGGLPYQLWRSITRELALSTDLNDLEAGILKELAPDIGALIGRDVAAASELPGQAGRQRLILTLVDVLKRQTQPLILLLEDLQWAEESLAPLKQILALSDQLPKLLVLGTYRDDERPHLPDELPGAQILKLRRLGEEAIGQLAQSMLGEAGRQTAVLDLLRRETEGNVFFMVETVRVLAEESGRLSEIGRKTLPEHVFAGGVQQIVRRRLGHVPEWTQPMLKLAAVAGRELDVKVLGSQSAVISAQKLGLEAFLTACADVAVLEVVEGRWRFAHDKLREAVLTDLPHNEGSQLHRTVALAIEAAYPADESYHEPLMEHWRAAGDAAKELTYLLPGVRRLAEITANYERAIQLGERGLTLMGEEDTRRSTLLNSVSRALWRRGDYASGRNWAEKAQQAAERHSDQIAMANSLNSLGLIAFNQGQYRAAENYHQASLDIRRAIGDQRGIASSLNNLGNVAYEQGGYRAALDYYQQSLVSYRVVGDQHSVALVLNNLGNIEIDQQDNQAALDYYQQSLAIKREIGDRQGIATALNNLGIVEFQQKNYSAATDYYQQSLVIRRAIGDQRGIASSLNNLGTVAADHGDTAAAADYYEQSLVITRAIGDRQNIVNSLNNLGFARLDQKNLTAAADQFHESLAIGDEIGAAPKIMVAILGLALLKFQSGETIHAAELAGFINHHPATEPVIRDNELATFQSELAAALPADELALAQERGKALDLDTVVNQLLSEGTPAENASSG